MLSTTFIIKIDHHSLKYLLEQKIGTPTQQKWIFKLLGYEFSIEFKSGNSNRVADTLSRCVYEVDDAMLAVISFQTPLWLQELK